MSVKKNSFKTGQRVAHKHAARIGTIKGRHDAKRVVVRWDCGLLMTALFTSLKKIN